MFDLARSANEARRFSKMENIYHRGQSIAWDGNQVLEELWSRHGKTGLAPEQLEPVEIPAHVAAPVEAIFRSFRSASSVAISGRPRPAGIRRQPTSAMKVTPASAHTAPTGAKSNIRKAAPRASSRNAATMMLGGVPISAPRNASRLLLGMYPTVLGLCY